MFGKPHIDMSRIVPTSKISLKMSCLSACGNDIDKAEKLYRFLSEGIDSLPDFEPIQPSGLEQIRKGADDVLGWLGTHKEDIMQGVAFVQSFRAKSVASVIPDVAPIPDV